MKYSIDITRENLVEIIQTAIKEKSLTIAELERQAGVTKDTVRDFLRGKTYIPRADKLQKILFIIRPDIALF